MSDESKIRRDKNDNPKYDKFTDHDSGHVHQFGGYTKDRGQYYEGGHGENTSDETKKSSGNIFRKRRGE